MDPLTIATLASKILPAITGKGGSSDGSGGGGTGSQGLQAGLSLGTSLLQNVRANKFKKQAESAMPDEVDPTQASFLAELNQKRRSIETGADFQEAMNEADSSQASANDAIIGAAGGNTNVLMQALLQSQRVAGSNKNKAIAQGQQQQMNYDTAFGNMLNKIAGRKLELQMFNQQQARADYATTKQAANQNAMAGFAGLASMGGGGKSTPAVGGAPATPDIAMNVSQPEAGSQSMLGDIGQNSGELSTLLNDF